MNIIMEENKLSNLLTEARKKKKMSKVALAKKSGVSRTNIYLLEKGERGQRPTADTLIKLANALETSAKPFLEAAGARFEEPVAPVGKTEDWEKHAVEGFIKVNVYPDYVRAHAGDGLNVIDYISVKKPSGLPYNIKAYRVNGDCLEPELHDGDYVIVDHDRQIDNGDKVVCICDDQVHVAKLKIIGGEFWLENRYATRKMTDCQGIAKVIGKYTEYK
jgi:phage repressor protein C with HTH and peptisase S24 domain